jgi:hypothetical protein
MTCDEVRISLGVYVLGALDDDESAQVEAHLDGCPACQAELAELSGLPPLLARVSEEDIRHAAGPPRAVLDRMLVASAKRKHRSRVVLSIAASVLVAALGGTAWLASVQTAQNESATAAGAPMSSLESGPAEDRSAAFSAEGSQAGDAPADAKTDARPKAQQLPFELTRKNGDVELGVRLTAEEGGTKVLASVSGVPSGTRCRLVAVGRDGTVSPVASWTVTPEEYRRGKASFDGSTEFLIEEIQRLELITSGGRKLVTIAL